MVIQNESLQQTNKGLQNGGAMQKKPYTLIIDGGSILNGVSKKFSTS